MPYALNCRFAASPNWFKPAFLRVLGASVVNPHFRTLPIAPWALLGHCSLRHWTIPPGGCRPRPRSLPVPPLFSRIFALSGHIGGECGDASQLPARSFLPRRFAPQPRKQRGHSRSRHHATKAVAALYAPRQNCILAAFKDEITRGAAAMAPDWKSASTGV